MHFRRLWNGMFDRHRAEITVMQFTGHSLPVHQFVTVPWDFKPVPYCQLSSPTRSLPITGHRNMHFHRPWNGMFGRVGGQYNTQRPIDSKSNHFMISFYITSACIHKYTHIYMHINTYMHTCIRNGGARLCNGYRRWKWTRPS